MSGYTVEIAPGAEGDVADAFTWYRERNALIAEAFRAPAGRACRPLRRPCWQVAKPRSGSLDFS